MSLTKCLNNRSAGMNVKHIIAPGRDLHTRASHLEPTILPRSWQWSEIESYLKWTPHVHIAGTDAPGGIELCGHAADLLRGMLGFGGCELW